MYSLLFVYYYLMFDLTFNLSFLLIFKKTFYHSPKLYHPQPLVKERRLSISVFNYIHHVFLVALHTESRKEINKTSSKQFTCHIFLLNILNFSLMFDLSLQVLKGDTCRSHSST